MLTKKEKEAVCRAYQYLFKKGHGCSCDAIRFANNGERFDFCSDLIKKYKRFYFGKTQPPFSWYESLGSKAPICSCVNVKHRLNALLFFIEANGEV